MVSVHRLLLIGSAESARAWSEVFRSAYPNAELVTASSIAEAIAWIGHHSADAAVVDLALSEHDPTDAPRQLRQAAGYLPLVAVQPTDDVDLTVRAVRAGADDCLAASEVSPTLVMRTIRYAIERRRTRLALSGLAIIDDATGLYNRHGFMSLAGQQWRVAQRSVNPFALMAVEVHGLNRTRETLGDLAADHAVADLGAILHDHFRASDIIARTGADTFMAFLVDAKPEVMTVARQRVLQAVRSHLAAPGPHAPLEVSVVIVQGTAEAGVSLETLMRTAEAQLAAEKAAA
jgi:two-component system cell cycle response regulator